MTTDFSTFVEGANWKGKLPGVFLQTTNPRETPQFWNTQEFLHKYQLVRSLQTTGKIKKCRRIASKKIVSIETKNRCSGLNEINENYEMFSERIVVPGVSSYAEAV